MDNSIERTSVATNIRMFRKKLNITQEAMAEKLGIKRTTYARYETDTIPPVSIITELGDIFSVTTDDLLRSNVDYISRIQNAPLSTESFSAYQSYSENQPDVSGEITQEEIEMIIHFRSLSPEQRASILELLK
jgi:transcriptional regulator with XRE-family HTH domain